MKISRSLPAAVATALAVAFVATPAFAATPASAAPHALHQLTEKAKIEALIAAVEAQPKAVFIRNGSEHTAAEAAEHLRMKWKHAGDRVATAGQFIDGIASKSSMTGLKYRIRLADGHEMDAGDFFRAELARIEKGRQ